MNKELLISELERWIKYVNETRLTGIPGSGHKDYDKYPKGTPGIHPYFDSEVFNELDAKALIYWLKTDDIIIPHPEFAFGNKTNVRINTMNYLKSNPHYDTLLVGECNRGMDILLALAIKQDWKKIYCYDTEDKYEKLIKDFFNDDRITFFSCRSERFDMSVIPEDNIIFVLSFSFSHSYQWFLKSNKIKKIIFDGVEVYNVLQR